MNNTTKNEFVNNKWMGLRANDAQKKDAYLINKLIIKFE